MCLCTVILFIPPILTFLASSLYRFAAALINQKFDCWVMNVVPVTEPNTLPVIYDRGLLGVAHDWYALHILGWLNGIPIFCKFKIIYCDRSKFQCLIRMIIKFLFVFNITISKWQYLHYFMWLLVKSIESSVMSWISCCHFFTICMNRCEPFDTYPRTYDLLHASGLFSKEQKR